MLLYKKYFLAGIIVIIAITTTKIYASDTQPFLYLPFSYKNFRSFQISEGWRYSGYTGYMRMVGEGEYAIHGIKQHSAVDYALPYGTRVLSPMNGYLIASYHNAFLKKAGYFTLYEGIQLHFGLGWHVQIWNPDTNIFVVLGHLSSIDETLPVSPPYPTRGKKGVSRRDPTGVTYNLGVLQTMISQPKKYPGIIRVKRGQRIGTVGISGIEWDNTMKSELPIPRQPESPMGISRDEPHIHMEVFTIVGNEKKLLDPYDLYGDFPGYPDSNTLRINMPTTLFVKTNKGRIRFADEK